MQFKASFVALVAGFAIAASPGQTTHAAVATAAPATFAKVFSSAKGGDTIVLQPGEYRGIKIAGRSFQPALVIDARAASFEGFALEAVKGLEIRGGSYRLPPPTTHPRSGRTMYGFALRMDRVDGVKIDGVAMEGPGALQGDASAPFGDGYGVFAVRSNNVSVTGSRFQGFKSGIVLSKVDGFKLAGNHFRAMRSDGIQVGEGRHGLIQHNDCAATRVLEADHPDCIQLWSRPSSPPTADVVIRSNRANGRMQGVFLGNHVRDGVDDGGFDRITIEDNDLTVGFPQGIAIMGGRASVVRNNQVRTLDGARWRASINLVGGDTKRCGNTVVAAAGKPGIKDRPCGN